MLTLYHVPISSSSRPVWITLIEKGLEFELREIKLINEDQLKPEFLEINPFHHIPVLLDDGFKIVESLAILDYLESKYPTPAMLPTNAQDLAIVRMVQQIYVNEMLPLKAPLMSVMLNLPGQDTQAIAQAQVKVTTALQFLENLLDDRPYFGSNNITLAEVVAGTIIPALPKTGISLDNYPKLSAWCDRLLLRPAWQTTQPTAEMMQEYHQLWLKRIAVKN